MKLKSFIKNTLAACIAVSASTAFAFNNGINPIYQAPKAAYSPTVDGFANESVWATAPWRSIGYMIIDSANAGYPAADDISGRYKVVWRPDAIYLLAEISDNHLSDMWANPVDNYYNDDALEIFIDEDNSGGYHGWEPIAGHPELEHNAYSYHISLDNQAVDVGPDAKGVVAPHLYPSHITAAWKRDPITFKINWEVKISVFTDKWLPSAPTAGKVCDDRDADRPIHLKPGKMLGFMVSLIDADGDDLDHNGKQARKYFMGDVDVPVWTPAEGGYPMPDWVQKNRGWIDANVFGNLLLVNDKNDRDDHGRH